MACVRLDALVYTADMDEPKASGELDRPSPRLPRIDGIAALVLVALAVAAGFPALDGPLAGDDFRNLRLAGDGFDSPSELLAGSIQGTTSAAARAVFFGGRRLFGLDAAPYHALSLLLHAVASALVFAAAFLLTREVGAALAAGAVFALLPIHGAAVFWISGIGEVLGAFFALLAAVLFLRITHGRGRWIAAAGSLVSAAFALLASIAPLALPLLLLPLLLAPRRDGMRRRTAAGAGLLLGHVTLVAIGVSFAAGGRPVAIPFALPATAGEGLFRTAEALGAILYPFDLYQVEAWYQARPLLFQLAGAGFVVLVVPTIVVSSRGTRGRWTLLAIGAIWFAAAALPVLGLLQRRFLYLPSAGAALALGSLVFVPRGSARPIGAAALLVLVAAYGFEIRERALDWRGAGERSRMLLRSLDTRLDEAAGRDEIFFLDLPWGYRSALLFTHDSIREAIALRRGGRPTVRILSRVVLEGEPEEIPPAERVDERVFRCRLEPATYRAFVIGSPAGNARGTGRLAAGSEVAGRGFLTTVEETDALGRVSAIRVDLDTAPSATALVLDAAGGRFHVVR